eukprot:TRINITY_DN34114_c0_g1_i1.p2 TRINITY_DN34114_c0_g1~~TRINITY_DN34114_c0_g1_i1.p2  ORF type:complete len:357 (+),score=94.33 TRINITY_DN34114_c0_g1_i1:53-1072(+)
MASELPRQAVGAAAKLSQNVLRFQSDSALSHSVAAAQAVCSSVDEVTAALRPCALDLLLPVAAGVPHCGGVAPVHALLRADRQREPPPPHDPAWDGALKELAAVASAPPPRARRRRSLVSDVCRGETEDASEDAIEASVRHDVLLRGMSGHRITWLWRRKPGDLWNLLPSRASAVVSVALECFGRESLQLKARPTDDAADAPQAVAALSERRRALLRQLTPEQVAEMATGAQTRLRAFADPLFAAAPLKLLMDAAACAEARIAEGSDAEGNQLASLLRVDGTLGAVLALACDSRQVLLAVERWRPPGEFWRRVPATESFTGMPPGVICELRREVCHGVS